MASLLEMARSAFGALLAIAGLAFVAGGALGLLRFPDFYTRVHATSAASAVGAPLVLLGLTVAASDAALALRLLLLTALTASVAPTMLQLVANAAHAGGLAPMIDADLSARNRADNRGGTHAH